VHNPWIKQEIHKNFYPKINKFDMFDKTMKRRLYDTFIRGRKFEREFRRQTRMLIVITLGFTIAFTWRQTIFDLSQELVNLIIDIQSSALSSILTSAFITLVSILLIYLSAQFLKEGPENS